MWTGVESSDACITHHFMTFITLDGLLYWFKTNETIIFLIRVFPLNTIILGKSGFFLYISTFL